MTGYARPGMVAWIDGNDGVTLLVATLDGETSSAAYGGTYTLPAPPGSASFYRYAMVWHSDGSLMIRRRYGSASVTGYGVEWWRFKVAADLSINEVAYFGTVSAAGYSATQFNITPGWPTGVVLDRHEDYWSLIDIDGATITRLWGTLVPDSHATWAATGAADKYAISYDLDVTVFDGGGATFGTYSFTSDHSPTVLVYPCGSGFLANIPDRLPSSDELAIWTPGGWSVGDSLPTSDSLTSAPMNTISGWVLAAFNYYTKDLWVYPLNPNTGALGSRVPFTSQGYASSGWNLSPYAQQSGGGYLASTQDASGTVRTFGVTMANGTSQSPFSVGIGTVDLSFSDVWCIRPYVPKPTVTPPLFQLQRSGGFDAHAYAAVQRTTRQSSALQAGML